MPKFQLTSTSTRATFAMALCWASARIVALSTGSNICVCEIPGLSVKLKRLDVCFRAPRQSTADLGRCGGQLLHSEGGHDKDEFTLNELLHEPDPVLRELFILAATGDRSFRIDPNLMSASYPGGAGGHAGHETTDSGRRREGCQCSLCSSVVGRGDSVLRLFHSVHWR